MMRQEARISDVGEGVLLEIAGRGIVIPAEAAVQLAEAMLHTARVILNRADPEGQSFDQGLLIRAGIPLNLTTDPRILEMGKQKALYDRELRRAMPMVANTSEVYSPTIKVN